MSAPEKHICEMPVYIRGTFDGRKPCGRTATLEHKGHWFCKTHHPPTQDEKANQRYQAYSAKLDQEIAKRSQIEADHARMEALCAGNWHATFRQILDIGSSYSNLRSAIDQWVKERKVKP